MCASVTPNEAGRCSAQALVRHVALLGAASVVAGVLIGGVGGRLVMRVSAMAAGSDGAGLVTENGNTVGELTIGGTVALVVFAGGLGGVLASLVIFGAEPWLRWMGPVRGLGFGLSVLAAYFSFDSPDFVRIDPPVLNVAMFVGLFIAFGFTVSAVYWLFDSTLPPASDAVQIGYATVASIGCSMALLVAGLFFTAPGFCGCEPAHLRGLVILVMVASTVVSLAVSASAAVPRWLAQAGTFTGYSALAVLLAAGLSRTIDQIREII